MGSSTKKGSESDSEDTDDESAEDDSEENTTSATVRAHITASSLASRCRLECVTPATLAYSATLVSLRGFERSGD